MPPKGKVQTNQELQERLDALEVQRLRIRDLPLSQLKRELAKEPVNPVETLLPKSIGPSLITNDFLRLGASGERLIYSGAISAAGLILNGSKFSCTRTSAGNYTIKLTSPLTSAGSLFVEVNGPFTQIHKSSGPSLSEWSIVINGFNGLGGGSVTLVPTDEAFSFYVIQH